MRVKSQKIKGLIFASVVILCCFCAEKPRESLVKEVIKEKRVEVEVEKKVYVEVEPKKHYDVTNEEREMIARLLFREVGLSSQKCQRMIVSVIFNRYDASAGKKSLSEIVYETNQFTPAPLLYRTTPKEENYKAVDYVIKNGSVLPHYVRYFRADYHFNWRGYKGYTNIDGTYFGYLTKDKNN